MALTWKESMPSTNPGVNLNLLYLPTQERPSVCEEAETDREGEGMMNSNGNV